MLGAAQDLLHREVAQCVQPQLLDLVDLGLVGIGGVVLVVVVEAEQGKHLVDRLGVALAGGSVFLSLPSWCR